MGKANEYLHNILQISRVQEAEKYAGRDVLLFSDKASFTFRSDNLVETNGLRLSMKKLIY